MIESHRLDETKTEGRVIQGIEYDKDGRKTAFHFVETDSFKQKSKRIPAEDIIHIFRKDEASQTRGVSWLAPVILRLKDFDDYEDAELLRQKIAACFVGFYRDLEPQGDDPFSSADGSPKELTPGTIMKAPSGQTIEFANPPQPVSYASYAENAKLTIATGLGVPYMMLSGDYSRANYSSSRMSMMNFHRFVRSTQENTILPKLKILESWILEAFELMGHKAKEPILWAVPPKEFIDPLKDIEAHRAIVEAGFRSHGDVIRELGNDPSDVYEEIAENKKVLEKLGIHFHEDKHFELRA